MDKSSKLSDDVTTKSYQEGEEELPVTVKAKEVIAILKGMSYCDIVYVLDTVKGYSGDHAILH